MRIPLTTAVLLLTLICGAGIGWRAYKKKSEERKLAQTASLRRAQAEQGDAQAQSDLARMYYYGKGVPQDNAVALAWYRKGADQGNREAEYGLGLMYWQGKGVPQDPTQAMNWFRRAAEHGYAKGQYFLGNAYSIGRQVPQNDNTAATWYRKAAEQGFAEAEYAIGYMYVEGKAVPHDDSEAVAWFRKGAEHGYVQAQSALAYMYFEGKGVQRNYPEAARWYRKAAQQGDEYSRRALASMNLRFDTFSKVTLSIAALGCISLLIMSKGDIRNRQQRGLALAGLLGLLRVGLGVYGRFHYGILMALSAVNAFYFAQSMLSGILVAMLLSIIWPKVFKIALAICALPSIGFNLYAIMHYDLRHPGTCPRAFYSGNGLIVGMAVSGALLTWLAGKRQKRIQSRTDVSTVTC